GISDLYMLDLETGHAERLTNDLYAQLHPAFSPDGRTIAYATERGEGTDLSLLSFGPYRLELLDLETREVRAVPGMDGARNLNPVSSRDGRSIFFLSNRGGIPNLYRIGVDDGAVSRLTNLFTGISGIIDVSPAITGARSQDRILFTAYEDGGYNIYSLEGASALAGSPVAAPFPGPYMDDGEVETVNAALLPPSPRPREGTFNRVSNYLADASTGLPSRREMGEYAEVPYRPRLGLDYLGQPQMGVTMGGPFGGGMYGAIAGIFSDVLGRHTLAGAVQAQGQIDEIGFATQYLNTRERWNY